MNNKCRLCGSEKIGIICDRPIRDGGIGKYTNNCVKMYKCEDCGVIWHDNFQESNDDYYESAEYRESMEGSTLPKDFYKNHDVRSLEKFKMTGTDIFRDKVVADIGCGAGAFLDFISGVAETVIGVEPSKVFRDEMTKKGFMNYPYIDKAVENHRGNVDVVTSFDVIEHVDNPEKFLKDVYELLGVEGIGIIGTPTESPIWRELLGESYEKQILFNTPHLWIFSEKNLKEMAKKCGFKNIEVKYYQRYGIDNLLGWLLNNKPQSEYNSSILTNTINNVFKAQCEDNKLADFIVLYVKK